MKAQKRDKPKDKAQKEGTAQWKKVVIIAACVLFVAMSIISFSGLSKVINWGTTTAKTGNTAIIDYTLKDELGRPLVTSNERIFNETLNAGGFAMLSAQLNILVNSTATQPVTDVPVYIQNVGQMNYGILAPEMNVISQGLTGMKTGDQKNIILPGNLSMSTILAPDEFTSVSGINISSIKVGDQIPLRLTAQSPLDTQDNSTASDNSFLRIAHVVALEEEGVTLEYGLSSADVTLVSLK